MPRHFGKLKICPYNKVRWAWLIGL